MSVTNHRKVIDVDQATFQTEVIQRSHESPVIVDFWAPWCGPCRMLGPILERLASEPQSSFVLAKVNADHNPQLSMQYGVRGIPAVKAFANGRMVDEFVGAQPEPTVRQFIQRVTAAFRPQSAPKATATPKSSDPAARLNQARQLLRQGKGCEALSQLQDFPAGGQAASAVKLLPLANFLCEMSRGGISGASELDGMYRQVGDALRRRDFAAGMYHLLAILHRNSQFRDGQARKVMLGLFELLGDSDPLTQAYRQQMNAVVSN